MTATISTHVLNGADGSHAGGVRVRLVNLTTGAALFVAETDSGGRLSRQIDLTGAGPADRYELGFGLRSVPTAHERDAHMEEIALRFTMPEPERRYHIPLILSPNAASLWWSVPE